MKGSSRALIWSILPLFQITNYHFGCKFIRIRTICFSSNQTFCSIQRVACNAVCSKQIKIIPATWALNRCDKCGARMQSDVTPENHASHPLTSHISTVLQSGLFATDFGNVTRQYHTIRWNTFSFLTRVFSSDLSYYCIFSSCYISIRSVMTDYSSDYFDKD
jgi:hypothetical protein